MAITQSAVPAFCERLDLYRHWQAQISEAFYEDGERQVQLGRRLVDLALSLSEEQVRRMEHAEGRGIPVAERTGEQRALLLEVERAIRALYLLEGPARRLEASAVDFRGTGLVRFTWGQQPPQFAVTLYWLPYACCAHERRQSFGEVQSECRERASWLKEQHALDATRLTGCSRLLFQLALTLTPEQIARMADPDALWVTRLGTGQRTLLEAAARMHPSGQHGDLEPLGPDYSPRA